MGTYDIIVMCTCTYSRKANLLFVNCRAAQKHVSSILEAVARHRPGLVHSESEAVEWSESRIELSGFPGG